MRYLWFIFLVIPILSFGQDKKVTALPADTILGATDLFYVIDHATTSKKMSGTTVIAAMDSLDDIVREEVGDTSTVLRALIAGGTGALTKSGHYVSLTDQDDTLSVGTVSATDKFNLGGNAYVYGDIHSIVTGLTGGNVYGETFIMNGGGMLSTGDDLYLWDNNTPATSLSSLKAGSSAYFGLTGTTRYTTTASENWHFGGTSASSYKMKITGSAYVTDDVNIEDYLNFPESGYNTRLESDAVSGTGLILTNSAFPTYDLRLNAYDGAGISSNIYSSFITMHTPYIRFGNSTGIWYLDKDSMWTETGGHDRFALLSEAGEGGGLTDTVYNYADTLRLDYLDDDTDDPMFVVVKNGALDSGWLDPVARGLTDKILNIHKHLADTKNKEIRWVHIENGDTVSTYGLPKGMDAFEALQYTTEMSLRILAEQDKRIAFLERKDCRMSRQDYRYKVKLLKAEKRLK